MSNSNQRLETIFHTAQELTDPEQREIYLRDACQGNPALRAKVEALLGAAARAESVFATSDNAPAGQQGTVLVPVTERPGDTIGRYKLLQTIGEGGMGVVYMAEQTEPVTRKVALKIIKLGMDTKQVVARFEAERQALAMMDHPNIARVLDAGTTETGRPFFVMELVRGVSITEYCDKNKLSTRERLDLFIQVCSAIQHAHQKGVIHRDIKPSNVMVTLHDGKPVPKVIDFGIAKATNQKLTEKTLFTNYAQMIGTPAYMSPEQAEMSGLDVDTRTDVYSLGVLLYELLTGTTPFPSKELLSMGYGEMQKIIAEKEPPKPSTRLSTMQNEERTVVAKNRSVDEGALSKVFKGDLDWIVMKALEKDRARRYETANGLAADLKRHLENEPVIARPPSAAYRVQKLIRRNKLAFAAATAVSLALLVGIVASTWHAVRATRAERAALQARAAEAAQRKAAQASEQKAVEAGQRALAGAEEARRSAALARRLAYVTDMAFVHQGAEQGNLLRAKNLLDRYRPKAGEEDIRGFEWRYLWGQTQSGETARLGEGYSGRQNGLALSPDGIYLASITAITARGVEIRSLKNQTLIRTLTNAGVDSIQFSPDSHRLALGGQTNLAIFNTRTWQKETELPGAKEPFAFARNGEVIVARHDDHLALWSLHDFRKIADLPGDNVFRNTGFSTIPLAVSSDGNRVFQSAVDGDRMTIRVWDLRTQTELDAIPLPAQREGIYSLAVSSEGLLAAAHGAGKVTLWDSQTGELLNTFADHLTSVYSVAFSPDGSYLATGGGDQNIFLYKTSSLELLRRFKGHEGWIGALKFSADGRWLVSGGGGDRSVRLWEVTELAQAVAPLVDSQRIYFIEGNRALIGQSTNSFLRIDVKTGATRPLDIGLLAKAHPIEALRPLSVSPDGTRAVIFSTNDVSLRIWNLVAGAEEKVLQANHPRRVRVPQAVFSGDGKRLAFFDSGAKTLVWNTADWSSKSLDDSVITNVFRWAVSHNGSRLAQGSARNAEVLDLTTGKRVRRFESAASMLGLALSPDGTVLAIATSNNRLDLWNVDQGHQMGTLRGHLSRVNALAFTPDGKTLASGSSDSVKLWNLETQQEILNFAGLGSQTIKLLFASDGSCLAANSTSGKVQLWRAPSFEEIAATEAKEQPPVTSAEMLSRAGKYAEAAQATRELLKSQGTELDSGTGSSEGVQRLTLAATLLAAGDRDGYRAACAEAAASRWNTTDPTQAEQIAKACLLAPDSGVDAASLAALVATAQAREAAKHWLQLVNALAEYRLGHWNSAADWAKQTRANPEAPGRCTAGAFAILAMAEHQQKQSQKARAALNAAQTAIAANWPAGTEAYWRDWLIADLLAKEAEALINKTAAAAKP